MAKATISALPAVLALLAAVAYGVVRPANEAFASRLGLTPEDLGANQAVLITTALSDAGFVVVTAGAALLVGTIVFWLFSAWFRHRFAAHPGLRSWVYVRERTATLPLPSGWIRLIPDRPLRWLLDTAAFVAVVGGFLATSWLAIKTMDVLSHQGLWPGASWMGFGILVGPAAAYYWHAPRQPKDGTQESHFRELVALVLLVALVVGVLATRSLDQRSGAYAGRLLAGTPTPGDQNLERVLVGQHSPAQVISIGDKDPLGVCDGVQTPMLIGATDNAWIIVIYPSKAAGRPGTVLRLPADQYSIRTGLAGSLPCTRTP